ncbi:MAG TPA: hypothetical protein VMT38_05705 [Terracidiphilus sp.]|nr:hypothetical protein [Terracidiphilus sp.]
MFEVQERLLSPSTGVRRAAQILSQQPILLRNNRVLIFLSFFGSLVALGIALCMTIVAARCFLPFSTLNLDRFAAGALWAFGAWLMAMTQVFLWRQGIYMGNCSVLLDAHGAHFRLDNTAGGEVFMPWNGIEAVHYKNIENVQKFTILGADSTTVTFTSASFYRPRRVARLIADHAGLPLMRG